MEKNQKSPSELNNNAKSEESNKSEQEKILSNTKETNTINTINFPQKNNSFFRSSNTNNNLIPNTQSLYPLLFT